ncbi:hypothetical protein GPK34_00850 [Secundilactobacillus kimchicus]|uniref:hypothetical protein n=1 Tax=Secundilactobacillus kimchicus TaxID=528209 RepID=UPI001C00FFA6|nr:hypothetical protein [Secundilactobacillus kimchicus]MBT9670587.1 hypothetical protein [Secundilactobacillus kimchicus]
MSAENPLDYDPFFFENVTPEPHVPTKPREAPVNDSLDDIDPKLDKNTVPFQRIKELAFLLERTGIPTLWEQAIPCPCINPTTNQPRSDCPICNGRGVTYRKGQYINIAYQSDLRAPYSGGFNLQDTGSTVATPQITENGIENGIAIRDRLTIQGMTRSQSYIFNVSKDRFDRGVFIPYYVLSFDYVVSMDENNHLYELAEGKDFSYDKRTSTFKVLRDNLLNHSISMNLTTYIRYYVADIDKETRYAQVEKRQDKEIMMNEGNVRLTKYFQHYKDFLNDDIVIYRMPKKLTLKREELFLGSSAFDAANSSSDPQTNSHYIEPQDSGDSIDGFLGG